MPDYLSVRPDGLLTSPEFDRNQKKKQRGCVIRSFESAFNVTATEPEWDLRLKQTDQLRSTTGRWRFMEQNPEKTELIRQEYDQELKNIKELISTFRRGNSALANALNMHRALFVAGNINIIHKLLDQSAKILYLQPHHMMHIARLSGTRMIYSVSDPDHKIYELGPANVRRDLLAFTLR